MDDNKVILSIIIVTMNRELELKRALKSCLSSTLPVKTEFIIIDNASTDNTEFVVRETLINSDFKYIKLKENIGCAPARNVGFDKANGKYLYFMDDDLYIPKDIYNSFFVDMISVLESDSNLCVLTNNIYDETYEMDLKLILSKDVEKGIADSFVYHGGSHFLRKNIFTSPLYPEIPFGVEELVLSLELHSMNKRIACNCNYTVTHSPKYKAFDSTDSSYCKRLIFALSNSFVIRNRMFPLVFQPIIHLVYQLKILKYHLSKSMIVQLNDQIKKTNLILNRKRISLHIAFSLLRKFGLRILV